MGAISKIVAVLFWLLAAAVALHFIFTPFYDAVLDVAQVWKILNWPMAVGVVVALIVQCYRKRALGSRTADGPITREYLDINIAFYASLVLTLWFFWNWFDALTTGTGPQSDTRLVFWAFVDPMFVLISGVTGCYLWRCPCNSQQ